MVKSYEQELAVVRNPDSRKQKRIAVSSKRQISIPKEFFDSLNIGNEVMIELEENKMVIRPIRENGNDFSEYILKDLIAEGFEGEKLVSEFIYRKSQIKPAVSRMIAEEREKASEYSSDNLNSLFEEDE